MTSSLRYQACYCEENVWHLCADPRVPAGPKAVLVVSNAARMVAFFRHRGAPEGLPMVWDYHVVLAARVDGGWRVWDLDSELGVDVPLPVWTDESFAGDAPELAPRFRVIEASCYRTELVSDRSHMRGPEGAWSAPPPPWPPIGAGPSNLFARFVDLNADGPGRVVELEDLPAALDELAAAHSSKRP